VDDYLVLETQLTRLIVSDTRSSRSQAICRLVEERLKTGASLVAVSSVCTQLLHVHYHKLVRTSFDGEI
jgi:hypothetical protein